jgi:Mg2+ and Co2+ transporter CorA
VEQKPSLALTMSRDVEKSEDAVIDPLIDEAASVCEAKQGKTWTIDFEALQKLLGHEGPDDSESPPFQGTESYNAYGCTRKDSRGETPQKIILYSESSDSTIHAGSFNELGKFAHDLASIFSPVARVPWWLHVQNPTVNELRLLCSAFRVHPLTVEDILGQEIREKIEDYTTYYFACIWSFQEDASSKPNFNPCTIYLVVFPSGTLSFCFSDSRHGLHVRERIDLLRDHYAINSDWIFYAFV